MKDDIVQRKELMSFPVERLELDEGCISHSGQNYIYIKKVGLYQTKQSKIGTHTRRTR